MTSLFILLAVIVSAMNIINYTSVVGEADEVLALLSQNKGKFPGFEGEPFEPDVPIEPDGQPDKLGGRLPNHMSPELPYESRYFSVLMSEKSEIIHVDVSRIASVDTETAGDYAKRALERDDVFGFIGSYRYAIVHDGVARRIIFLDCGRKLDAFYAFLNTSVIIALLGFAIVFFVICFFAGRIVRPISESYEKQKRFITDAGHEIKTPLTIINANVDILEMENGPSESISDIRHETERLKTLTNDLVSLARMEEAEHTVHMIDFPVSEIVQEAAEPFKNLALANGKALSCTVQPMLTLKGNDRAISQLVSILLDNAIKYSSASSQISLTLSKQGRTVVLTVENDVEAPIERDKLDKIFDRFYRADASRNSAIGGHGIGLSLAKAIVTSHGGKIVASSEQSNLFKINAYFPI